MKWILIILSSVLVLFRFAYLDQDAPSYQLTNITQEDEPYYCQGAMNKFCASEGRMVKGFEKTRGEGLDEYNRVITYFSLKVLGNNYWGLRIPVVLASLMFLWLMYSTLKKFSLPGGLVHILILFLATNFYLFTYSRYFNPQIFSVLTIGVTLWLIVKYGFSKPFITLLIGVAAAFTVFFVYVLNFFFLAGIGMFLIGGAIRNKAIKPLLLFSAGTLLCFLFYMLCLSATGVSLTAHLGMILNFGMGGSGVVSHLNGIGVLITNLKNALIGVFNTGYLRYQLPLLFLAGAMIPSLVLNARKKTEPLNIALLLLLIMVFQIIQNCFVLSYPYKKMLVDLPEVLLIVALLINGEFLSFWQKSMMKKVFFSLWLIIVFLMCLFNYKTNSSAIYWNYDGHSGCYENTPLWFNIANIALCLVFLIAMFVKLFYPGFRYFKNIVTYSLLLSSFGGVLLSAKIFVLERKYEIRNCLENLEPELHGKVVSGGFPYTYSLYTNCTPVLHEYPVDYLSKERYIILDSLLVSKKIDYVITKANSTASEQLTYVNNKYLQLVKKFDFSCYSYYLYKNVNK